MFCVVSQALLRLAGLTGPGPSGGGPPVVTDNSTLAYALPWRYIL